MNTIKEFLEAYADRFPEQVNNREEFINNTTELSFDYADGLFDFYYFKNEHSKNKFETLTLTGSGGNNWWDFDTKEDYKFVWTELIEKQKRFMKFINDHNITNNDLMVLFVRWTSNDETIGAQETEVRFNFYNGLIGEES